MGQRTDIPMSELILQRWTGIIGIGIFALTMVEIPLYFVYSGPPPARNVLTRIFINLFVLMGVIAWAVGFQSLIVQARPDYEWLGTLCLAIGLAHVVVTFVADSIQAGSVLGQKERLDPTLVGSGAEGALTIYGPISRLLEAAFLASAGSALLVTGILPVWTGGLAYAVGTFNLALVPTLFSRTEPAYFYSINGWGIPVAGGLFMVWILVVSIVLVLG
jgi:hypothetical protein